MIKNRLLEVVKEIAVEATTGADDDVITAFGQVLKSITVCKSCQNVTLVGLDDLCSKCNKAKIEEEIREKMGDLSI